MEMIKQISAAVASAIIIYCAMAFVVWQWNPAVWSTEQRELFVVLVMLSIYGCIVWAVVRRIGK